MAAEPTDREIELVSKLLDALVELNAELPASIRPAIWFSDAGGFRLGCEAIWPNHYVGRVDVQLPLSWDREQLRQFWTRLRQQCGDPADYLASGERRQ